MPDNTGDEKEMFNRSISWILKNITKLEPETVREALNIAPQDVLEYLALDKWFIMAEDPRGVPIYSSIAREILMERIVLGGTEGK